MVPPIHPDVTIIHAQRADAAGDTQVWGLTGAQKEAAFAADRVIVVVEELVDEAVIRADPNRTIIPGLIVDAVVVEPYGAHPSYAQGHYDRDNSFYVGWDAISRDAGRTAAWLDEWVHGTSGRAEYMERLGPAVRERIAPTGPAPGRSHRLRRVPMSRATYGRSEMMIAAAARELAGQRVCFVGIGLPNIAVNLALQTVAPELRAHLRGRRLRCPARPAAAVDR